MDNSELIFMLILGFGILFFNKQFARSTLKSTIGAKVTETDLPKFRLLSIIGGLALIIFALFVKYITDWQFK